MNRFLPMLVLLSASACSTVRPLPTADSTKVEVRTVVETVHDTAYVELPVIIEKRATLDTASTLENKYAKTEAKVDNGILHHSLETKAVSVPVRVENKVVYKDSLVYRDRVQTVIVQVEKPLTGWQKAKQKVGGICFIAIILYGLYLIYSLISKLNLRVL
ncbi:MAG: hypothetical protein IK119_09730 [Bacteroidales bacterium]|nr:hypothetical protein [Bacteroidales bacterium]